MDVVVSVVEEDGDFFFGSKFNLVYFFVVSNTEDYCRKEVEGKDRLLLF